MEAEAGTGHVTLFIVDWIWILFCFFMGGQEGGGEFYSESQLPGHRGMWGCAWAGLNLL